ncbi:MAG: hypothetical protein LRZ85_10115 [Alphaproteobacteria bacterium]|nr:hypothetical protein [Alphaproteobacteria bacterium]MCD8525703.1 hypothetical protein [Alphaproteobacteria bacterium]MCD8570693.1 hypothetical protein [Alphaproteobacteria bacterium]
MKHLALPFLAVLILTACGTATPKRDMHKAQYWQRSSISDAAYQQGPKAQEMLNRDIANCVATLKEMERLGMVRNAIPADNMGRVLDRDEEQYMAYDTPDRFGGLNLEAEDYHDFEGCMITKGWERTMFVPYSVAGRSREVYLKSVGEYGEQAKAGREYGEDRREALED